METKNKTPQDAIQDATRQTARYRQGQFSRLKVRSGSYKPKVLFTDSDGTKTNHMDITADELAAIEKLLTEEIISPKVNILNAANAMQYSVKHEQNEKTDWYSIHQGRIESALLDVLPHGSGIDNEWSFDFTDKAIFCYNSYHRMNDGGMYVGWIDFILKIFIDHRTIEGKIDFLISGQFGKQRELKNYLCEIIGQNLETL